jgi:hypothetical protein
MTKKDLFEMLVNVPDDTQIVIDGCGAVLMDFSVTPDALLFDFSENYPDFPSCYKTALPEWNYEDMGLEDQEEYEVLKDKSKKIILIST